MNDCQKSSRKKRWTWSIIVIVAGLSIAWAWGRLAHPAGALPAKAEAPAAAPAETLYAAWQPAGTVQDVLFRSTDQGVTWQPVALPRDAAPVTWAGDGGKRLVVALADGSLFRSSDRGDHWSALSARLPVLSLAWGQEGSLYLGTDGVGVYRQAADGTLAPIAAAQPGLQGQPVRLVAVAGSRLFAATPRSLFYTDDEGATWVAAAPIVEQITALAATGRDEVLIGTATAGVYSSKDGGKSWRPSLAGLGLAAGQYVQITALRTDPQEPGVLYAAVGYLVGGTELHFSAAGAFVTLDGGQSWLPLAGPVFPEARRAGALVVVQGKPLFAQAVTAAGLQAYVPDTNWALAALRSDDPQARLNACRLLGLARSSPAGAALLAGLADPVPGVGLTCADALGRLNDPATIPGLLAAIQDPNQQLRLGAARALGLMRVEAAVPALRAMLLDGDGAVVRTAADAQGRIASPAATDALLAALADEAMTPRRHGATAALEAMGEPAVVPLIGLLSSSAPAARSSAAETLGWIGSPTAVQALKGALADASPDVRGQAAWALGAIGDLSAKTALERIHRGDSVASVREAAGLALATVEARPVRSSGWLGDWAAALNRLEPVRWLLVGLSLLGAAWLALGSERWSAVPIVHRHRDRSRPC